jgi:hypothetical protein
MNRMTLLLAATAATLAATPSLARDRSVPVYSDYNPYYPPLAKMRGTNIAARSPMPNMISARRWRSAAWSSVAAA